MPRRTPDRMSDDALPFDFGGPVDASFEPFPEIAEEGSVADRFFEMARLHASRPAIFDGDVSLTYAELAELVRRIASATAALPRQSVVAVMMSHGYRFVAAVLGVMAAGRICVPLDADHPADRNELIARHAGAVAVVSSGPLVGQARSTLGEAVAVIDADALQAPALEPPNGPGPDDIACILYTSGSTGTPKGVFQNHRGVVHNVLEWVNTAHIGPEDSMSLFYSPASIAGLGKMLIMLLTGGSLHVLSPVRLGAQALAREMARVRPTLVNCSPTLFRHIADALQPDQKLGSVRLLTVGGERVDWSDVDVFRRACGPDARMAVHLGATEVWVLHSQWFVDESLRGESPLLPVGRSMPGRKVTLVGEDGLEVPPGEVGEVVVSSRHVALGYWREPELSRAAFGTDPDDPASRRYRTGDLARQRPDGLREFAGRKDEQIKLHGYRIEPGEVEAALKSCPGVRDAAIVVRRTAEGHPKALAAYVTLLPDAEDMRPRHLMAMLGHRVPAHMAPAAIFIVEALPWLANFKLDRRRLTEMDAEAIAAPERSDDQIAAEIIAIFERALGVRGATAEDNLLSLGGDSLDATEIALELKRRFGLAVLPGDFIGARSIGDWAARVRTTAALSPSDT
jgi:amino acid adenylation domain-containing protein